MKQGNCNIWVSPWFDYVKDNSPVRTHIITFNFIPKLKLNNSKHSVSYINEKRVTLLKLMRGGIVSDTLRDKVIENCEIKVIETAQSIQHTQSLTKMKRFRPRAIYVRRNNL